MKPETFFKNFGHIADAPNGIEKLRELILQLAVSGRLGTQNPKDEPAGKLFEKIKVEKEALIKKEQIVLKNNGDTACNDFYEIPALWQWVTLPDICYDWGQKKPDKEFTYIDVGSVDSVRGRISEQTTVLKPNQAPSRARKIVKKDSVIYSTVRPYLLNIAIIEQDLKPEPIVSTAFAVLHPFAGVLNKYLYYYLRSKPFINFVESQMTGMAYPAISDSKLLTAKVPLPPFAEQKRIVEKVEKLIAMCDELEEQQEKRHKTRLHLNNSAIDKLLTSQTPKEFSLNWQRICDNFGMLYDQPETVDKLRQVILQLAMQGKLVPQTPKDEPAEKLFLKIEAEKECLKKEGMLKKIEPSESIKENDIPFELPKSWIWARLNSLSFQVTDGCHHTPQYIGSGIPFLSVRNISSGKFDLSNIRFISPEQHQELAKRCKPEYEDILFTKIGTTGIAKVIDIDTEFSIFVSLALLKFSKTHLFPYYLELMLNSPLVREQSERDTQGVGNKNLVLRFIKNFIVPLPPLAEQKRIVAKVDELMALCDELQKQLEQAQETSTKLTAAAIANLIAT